MEILIALLMAFGALAYPVYVDIRRHGKDNILRRSARDVVEWQPLASLKTELDEWFRSMAEFGRRALRRLSDLIFKTAIALALLWLVFWLASWLVRRFF